MLDQFFFGNTLQDWLIFLGTLAGATILGWIAARIVRWIAARTKNVLFDAITQKIARPLTVIFILLGLQLGLTALELPTSASTFFTNAIHFAYALIVTWATLRVYDVLHFLVFVPFSKKTDTDFDDHLFNVIRLVVKVLVIVLGVIIGLSNAGFDVGAALAGLGLGGLAFALAAQDTVSNLFGGMTVLVEKPFKVGDQIEIDGTLGFVQEIGLRTTLIESKYGRMIRIPNKMFTEHPIETITYTKTRFRIEQPFILRYDTSSDKIQQALNLIQNIIEQQEHSTFNTIGFTAFGEYGFHVELEYDLTLWQPEQQATIGTPRQKIDRVKTEINLAILKAFEENSIKLALPLTEEIGLEFKDRRGKIF